MKFHYRAGRALLNLLVSIWRGMEKKGREHIPLHGGTLIASNHITLFDPPLIGCASPRELYYVAKKELFSNRLFGWFIGKFNAIPISRKGFDREGLERATEVLKSGNALLVFPEGTRSKDGTLKELKLGAAKLALETGVPIVPAYLEYSGNWLRAFFQRKKIQIRFGSPINSHLLSQVSRDKQGYLRITQEIMQRIKALQEEK